ncbi:MAG: bifunctional homocysteine S-methyltransferase/methylenetetrahydrofolate reductase [Candidatus Auribacterota bacterium]|jgi:homocysteine S-methyltransferase|nr:bifunctional homocysteine S-methyltransferase/methylenetetrahydrofolate reductase [Candidatus Auribacterota bacterium]
MKSSFDEMLHQSDRIIVFDGAMGTYLYQKGVFINVCYEQLNLTGHEMVKEIHAEYIKAGADVITTNTFGANRFKLQQAGIDNQLRDIIVSGVRIAKQAAEDSMVFVAGDIGPIGKFIEPLGQVSRADAESMFREQIELFVQEQVDVIVFETFSDIQELELAIRCAQGLTDIPIIAHLSINEDGTTALGATPDQLADLAYRTKIAAVGFNCSVGPHLILNGVEKLAKYTDLIISVQPNAGMPKMIENRNMYLTTPEYFASYAKRYMLNHVRIVGGCCGIHPEHIKTLKNTIKSVARGFVERLEPKSHVVVVEEPVGHTPVPVKERSHLAKRILDGYFVSSVEITPPKGCNPQKVIDAARYLKASGVDAVNIPDGPRASARMSPQMLAVILEREVGMETIMHYCCRDRNVIGMQSDLLGAASAGLNNILAITGDPPKLGHYPNATAVFDVDAIGLVRIINRLNHGLDLAGNDIETPTKFLVGVGVNPVATNYALEIDRLHQKVHAGAEFAITQPVFDIEKLFSFLDDIKDIKIPILIGIWPLASYRNAEFLNSEIPEVSIPKNIMERMSKVSDKEEAKLEGVAIARETLQQVKHRVNGVQVSAPFGRVDIALKVVEGFIDPDPEYQRVTK